MKKLSPFLAAFFISLGCFSQNISFETKNIINSIRFLNELKFSDIDESGKATPQFVNYKKLLKTATMEELIFYTNDTSEVVKGYVCLALLEKKNPIIKKYYGELVTNKNKITSDVNGVTSTVYLYDFIRFRTNGLMTSQAQSKEDKDYFNSLYEQWDSIVIMNYEWKESDVLMDHIIEKASKENNTLSSRKRWLANSYFIHHIAKEGDDYLYGKECGYPATEPYLRTVMEKAMKDSNLNRLNYFDRWISCDLLVIKVYGAEALIRLQNEGVELTPIQIKVINELKTSYKSLQICSGYYKERKSVRRVLKPYNFMLSSN